MCFYASAVERPRGGAESTIPLPSRPADAVGGVGKISGGTKDGRVDKRWNAWGSDMADITEELKQQGMVQYGKARTCPGLLISSVTGSRLALHHSPHSLLCCLPEHQCSSCCIIVGLFSLLSFRFPVHYLLKPPHHRQSTCIELKNRLTPATVLHFRQADRRGYARGAEAAVQQLVRSGPPQLPPTPKRD